MKPCTFQAKIENQRNSRHENHKNISYKVFFYISGKRNPGNIFYISGNGGLEETSYILGNRIFQPQAKKIFYISGRNFKVQSL